MKRRVSGVLCLCGTVLVRCGWDIVGGELVTNLAPLTTLAFQCVFACPMLLIMAWTLDPIGMRTVPKSSLSWVFFLGILLIGGNSFLFTLGLKWTSALEAALTQPLITVFTSLLSLVIPVHCSAIRQQTYKTYRPSQKIGIACSVFGAIWILTSKAQRKSPLLLKSSTNLQVYRLVGFICLIGNTMCMSVYIWLQYSILSKLSPAVVTAYSYVLVTPLIAVASLASEYIEGTRGWMTMNLSQLLSLFYSGVVATAVTSILYSYATTWLHPIVCGLSAAWQPLTTCILGVIFLQERLSFQQAIAAMCIIGGVALVFLTDHNDNISGAEEESPSHITQTRTSVKKSNLAIGVSIAVIIAGSLVFSGYVLSNNTWTISQNEKKLTIEVERLQSALLKTVKQQQIRRAQLGEVSCALHGVGPTGGFCRQPGRPSDGGHHLDKKLCSELTRFFNGSTVYDLGAGMGQYTRCLRVAGNIDILAFDGAENIESATNGTVRFMDLSETHPWEVLGKRDWVLSLEVAEHIPAAFESTFLSNIDHANRKGTVFSWAIRNQSGYHHVNCRNNSEVISIFTSMGYRYDADQSNKFRSIVELQRFRRTLMIFLRIPSTMTKV